MAHSEKVIEHYENPRYVGTGMIEDAKFKTCGCGSSFSV
jgi:NifU-like protein involved in Fe-S cluster formation